MTGYAKLSLAATLLTTPTLAWAVGSIRIIAIDSGQGTTDGTSYSAFSNPVLNEAGQAAFVGFRVLGATSSQPDSAGGIYVGDGRGPLAELVKVGDPGFVPNTFANRFVVSAINDVGQVAYSESAFSAAGTSLSSGLFLATSATARSLVVKLGDLDPDGTAITQINFNDLDANGRIGLAFSHRNVNSSTTYDSSAVFEAGNFRVLAKENRPAPDGIGTVGLALAPSLNDVGQTHHSPRIARSGMPERPVLFRETPGVGRELLFRSEDATTAPTLGGTLLLEHYSSSMNETGLVVFAGRVTGATNPANNGVGVFVASAPNTITALVRAGQPVPGGETFAAFGRPSLNQAGDAAFYALLTKDSTTPLDLANVGIYRQSPANLTQIARDRQPTPSGDGKIDLPRFDFTPNYHTRPLFNDNGQVAFLTPLIETSSGSTNDRAVFFFSDTLGLVEIARTGSPLLDSTIVDLGLRQSNRNDGDEEVGFNDAGQISFRFALKDGREGIAIWSPDPSATSFKLTITPATPPAEGYDFEWDSQPGKLYDLVTSTDLAMPVQGWAVHDPDGEGGNAPYRDLPATGTKTRLTSVPRNGQKRFFAVVGKEARPAD